MSDPTAPGIDQQRAVSYGARAGLYDRVRPSYPPQALSCLVATLPAAPGSCHVVDVGAGAGKLTAVLAEAGFDVDAVEPDARMRAVLVERLPEVRWHWVNAAAGAEEAARVLRPGGVLAILWNYEDDGNAWFSAFERIVGIRSRGRPTPSSLQGSARPR